MRSHEKLLAATAVIEGGAGVTLVCLPALAIWLLLGVGDPSAEALVFGRIGGLALLSLGIVCGFAHGDTGSRSRRGLLWALLAYNVGASVVIALAGAVMQMSGILLWIAVILHAVMTAWCAASLRASAATG